MQQSHNKSQFSHFLRKWPESIRTILVSNSEDLKLGKEHSRKAAFRHGAYTKQAKTYHREIMALIGESKGFLQEF